MERREIYSYLYDFVSRLAERIEEDSIKQIIVFGSVVRGDFDKESDVDIFVDTKNSSAIESIVRKVLNEFYSHSRQTWVLRGVENQIKPIVGDLDSDKWSALKREIISNSLLLYGKYKELPENLKLFVLMNYDISKLKPKEKVRFSRTVFGYRQTQGKKQYNISGLIHELGGIKIGKNAIIVPKENQRKIYEFLSKSKASFEIREAWIKPD